MNELEKALEQLNIKYEKNGKKYKIPTTKENLVELLKGYIAMTINLQSKIDKAIDKLESLLPMCIMPNNMLIHGSEKEKAIEETLDILKEDK